MAHGTRRRDAEKEAFWRKVVAGQAESGLSVRSYCAGRGVSEASFFAWRRELTRRGVERTARSGASRRRREAEERHDSSGGAAKRRAVSRRPRGSKVPRESGPRWARLVVHSPPGSAPHGGGAIEIVLPSAVRLRVCPGTPRQTLVDVLAALGQCATGQESAPC